MLQRRSFLLGELFVHVAMHVLSAVALATSIYDAGRTERTTGQRETGRLTAAPRLGVADPWPFRPGAAAVVGRCAA